MCRAPLGTSSKSPVKLPSDAAHKLAPCLTDSDRHIIKTVQRRAPPPLCLQLACKRPACAQALFSGSYAVFILTSAKSTRRNEPSPVTRRAAAGRRAAASGSGSCAPSSPRAAIAGSASSPLPPFSAAHPPRCCIPKDMAPTFPSQPAQHVVHCGPDRNTRPLFFSFLPRQGKANQHAPSARVASRGGGGGGARGGHWAGQGAVRGVPAVRVPALRGLGAVQRLRPRHLRCVQVGACGAGSA